MKSLKLLTAFAFVFSIASHLLSNSVDAQSITPTVNGTGTQVIQSGNTYTIQGGAASRDRTNLFHQFERFGLNANEIANFLANPQTRNIFGSVSGGNPSIINGLIQVTGGNNPNLFLSNPAGIVFGTNASLNIPGSFTATTANGIGFGDKWLSVLGSNDYASLVGTPTGFAFTMGQPGAIVNAGNLAVLTGQSVTLMGGAVLNTGTIVAPGGNITIAAIPGTNRVRISQEGRLLGLELAADQGTTGVQPAPFSPKMLPDLLTIGRVPSGNVSVPTEGGTAIVSGQLSAATNQTTEQTPQINVLGQRVGLVGAQVDASGVNGGGTIRIGGDYQGKGTVFNSDRTFVSSDSVISADALNRGNGGRAIVWSNDATGFYGRISAKGGVLNGDGGFAEVSGKNQLDFRGLADLRAVNGTQGTLLLDPTDITISAAPTTPTVTTGAAGVSRLFQDITTTPSNISNTDLQDQLALSDVTITTTSNLAGLGDITVNAPITWDTRSSLTLRADRNITISPGANIVTSGGNVDLSSGLLTITGAAINTNGGNFTGIGRRNTGLASGVRISDNSTINVGKGTGSILLRGDGQDDSVVDGRTGITISRSTILSDKGAITLIGTGGKDTVLNLSSGHSGIALQSGTRIESASDKTIFLNGESRSQSAAANGNSSYGIFFTTNEPGQSDITVQSNNGDIILAGRATSTNGGSGIYLFNNSTDRNIIIRAIGSGSVRLDGSTQADSSAGVLIDGNGLSRLSAANRNIEITGTFRQGTNYDPRGIYGVSIRNAALDAPRGSISFTGSSPNGVQDVRLVEVSTSSQTLNLTGRTVFANPLSFRADIIKADTLFSSSTTPGAASLRFEANQQINIGTITAPSQSVTLISQGDITAGTIDTSSSTANGGAITLNAGGSITTGTLRADAIAGGANRSGGAVTLTAGRDIAPTNIRTTNNNISLNGTVNGNGTLTVDTGNGGSVRLNGLVGGTTPLANLIATTPNLQIAGGVILNGQPQVYSAPVTLLSDAIFGSTGTSSVTFNNTLNAGNNTLTIKAQNFNFAGAVSGTGTLQLYPAISGQNLEIAGSNLSAASLASLQSGFQNIVVGDRTGNITLGGNATFTSPVTLQADTIDATGGTLSGAGNATFTLRANQNITAGDIINSGRSITLNTTRGSLTTGNLNTSAPTGGNIDLRARLAITTGTINSSGSVGKGGNVFIDPIGDVQVTSINAQGGNNGRGGNVDITAGQFFRATGVFSDRNSTQASISTAGGLGGGNIILRHGTGALGFPFNIGDPTRSGTAGAITSGDFRIEPQQQLFNPLTIGNIQLVTSPTQVLPEKRPSPLPTPEPRKRQEVQYYPVLDPGIFDGNKGGIDYQLGKAVQDFYRTPSSQAREINPGSSQSIPPTQIAPTSAINTNTAPTIEQPTKRSLSQIRTQLSTIEQATGVRPALIYVVFARTSEIDDTFQPQTKSQKTEVLWKFNSPRPQLTLSEAVALAQDKPQDNDRLELILVTANGSVVRKPVILDNTHKAVTRKEIQGKVDEFRRKITAQNTRNNPAAYLPHAQTLYKILIEPLEKKELQPRGIGNLVFLMDQGLRSLPIAALHDGEKYLVEKYSLGISPSLNLTDTRYADPRKAQLLAMGRSDFSEDQDYRGKDLPGAKTEIEEILQLWQGKSFLNSDFNRDRLISERQSKRYGIIHLATHARFDKNSVNSHIKLWGSQITLDDVRTLGWYNPPVELVVLSACETASDNKDAELGFAGFAVRAGAKSALASLWNANDAGTVALMSSFYQNLHHVKNPIKAAALQQAQIAMINRSGNLQIENGQLIGLGKPIPLPKELQTGSNLSHPFYWAGFTMIGSPW